MELVPHFFDVDCRSVLVGNELQGLAYEDYFMITVRDQQLMFVLVVVS